MELKTGRPEITEGLLPREIRVYDFLDKNEITYERVDHHDIPAMTMEACEEIDRVLGVVMCKNLFLCNQQKTSFYMLLMPADKPFKTKEITKQIGSARLSFASPEYMLKYLDIEPGAVSLMGLMNDTAGSVRLLVDEDLLKEEYLGCHPCVNTASIKIKTADAFGKYLKAVSHDMTVVRLTGEA
ncbi:MAG: prolyl-tRNA synthetase associated domain-containing protein [Lachnospiraceae bacterium]|nr:prolyl-tRNA synthetase associated domain-containing protein [Lachnospiraceae bacterium]